MLLEHSKDDLVNLCITFRKAVVGAFENDPALMQSVMGAYTADELKGFEAWSAAAQAKTQSLQSALDTGTADHATVEKLEQDLDNIVLGMSEQSAQIALRVLGKDTLQSFIESAEGRTQDTSDRFTTRGYPNLGIIFAP